MGMRGTRVVLSEPLKVERRGRDRGVIRIEVMTLRMCSLCCSHFKLAENVKRTVIIAYRKVAASGPFTRMWEAEAFLDLPNRPEDKIG